MALNSVANQKCQNNLQMATVRTVKDVTLLFIHLICIVLCGWYGFHNLTRKSAHPTILISAKLGIAFGTLTVVNVTLFVTCQLCRAKGFLLTPFRFFATCLSLFSGGALVVMLGQATVYNREYPEVDEITLGSVLIAFTLILVLMQASTIQLTQEAVLGRLRPEDRSRGSLYASATTFDDTQGNFMRRRTQGPFAVSNLGQRNTHNYENFWSTDAINQTATIHRNPIPGMRISVSALDTAKKNLRKSPETSYEEAPIFSSPQSTIPTLPPLDEEPEKYLQIARKDPNNNNSRNLSKFPFEFSFTAGDDEVFFSKSFTKSPNQSVPLSMMSFHSTNESFAGKSICQGLKSTPIHGTEDTVGQTDPMGKVVV